MTATTGSESRKQSRNQGGQGEAASRTLRLPAPALETIALTLVFPALGYLIDREDPFLYKAAFPWLVLAPILCGLQHGLASSLACTGALFLGAWLHADRGVFFGSAGFSLSALTSLQPWGIGCLLAALVAGHFGGHLHGLSRRLRAEGEQLAERLRRLGKIQGVLQLSHAQLEERLAADRWSLESCVEEAAQRMSESESAEAAGRIALDLLANHAQVQAASLFISRAVREHVFADAAGEDRLAQPHAVDRCALEPCSKEPHDSEPARMQRRQAGAAASALSVVARLGNAPKVDGRHPLIARAWAAGRVIAVTDSLDTAQAGAPVLVALPLQSSRGTRLGLVAIHELPFLTFQSEHLGRLALLGARLADLIEDRFDGQFTLTDYLVGEDAFSLERKRSGTFLIRRNERGTVVGPWQSQSRKRRP